MGVAAGVSAGIGVISAISGASERNAQRRSAREAAILQAEANARAEQIALIDVEAKRKQLEYASDLEKMSIKANAQLADIQFKMNAIAERVALEQQSGQLNYQSVEAEMASLAQQYESIRSGFQEQQGLYEGQVARQNESIALNQQSNQINQQAIQALQQGDTAKARRLAQMSVKTSPDATIISSAAKASIAGADAAEEARVMAAVKAEQSGLEYLKSDNEAAAGFDEIIRQIIDSQVAADSAAASLIQKDTGERAAIQRSSLNDMQQSAGLMGALASQGVDLYERSGLLQTDINKRYGDLALSNEAFAIRARTGQANAQLQASIPRSPGVMSTLTGAASAVMPLASFMIGGGPGSSRSPGVGSVSVPLYMPGMSGETVNSYNSMRFAGTGAAMGAGTYQPVNLSPGALTPYGRNQPTLGRYVRTN